MKKIIIKGIKENREVNIPVSTIALGASDFFRKDNMDYAVPIIDNYIKEGGNTFDTARHYRYSDEAIGEYIRLRNCREQIVIFAKGGHPTREYPHIPRVNRACIINDLEESLKRLGVKSVDLYALHRDDPNVSVAEIIDTLDELVHAGKIFAIGTSNWSLDRIKEANEYARRNGKIQFTFNSPNLSLAKPLKPRWDKCISANKEMIKWHEENQIPLLSWSAQASGLYSGDYEPSILDNQEMVDVFYSNDNWERYNRLKKMALEKKCQPITLSLAWVINQKYPTVAIIGPETLNQLQEALMACNFELNNEEITYLNLETNRDLSHKFAIQLYSVRKELEIDLEGTIKQLANIGFKYVQMDGLRGNDILEFKRVLDKYQMQVVAMHIKHERFFNDINGIMKEASIFDCKYIINKYIEEEDQNSDGYIKTKEQLIKTVKKLAQFGYTVGLHNPEYDYNNEVNGEKIMDYICSPVDGLFVYPEPDTYWIYVSGNNYINVFEKYANRVPIIHLKDILPGIDKMDLEKNLCAIGRGAIDFKQVLVTGEKANVNYYVIEQDRDSRQPILKSLKESYEYLLQVSKDLMKG